MRTFFAASPSTTRRRSSRWQWLPSPGASSSTTRAPRSRRRPPPSRRRRCSAGCAGSCGSTEREKGHAGWHGPRAAIGGHGSRSADVAQLAVPALVSFAERLPVDVGVLLFRAVLALVVPRAFTIPVVPERVEGALLARVLAALFSPVLQPVRIGRTVAVAAVAVRDLSGVIRIG